jgi:threonine dehydratase
VTAAPTFADIQKAAAAIQPSLVRTPTRHSRTLSGIAGCEVWLKFENRQFTASFKERGALYRITGAAVNFRPNLEISEICFADPRQPPPGCSPATVRRLGELAGAPPSPVW